MEWYLIVIIILFILGLLYIFLYWIFSNPYNYPYKEIEIDVSHKRNVKIMDEFDRYLCEYSITIFHNHYQYVQDWKKKNGRQDFKVIAQDLEKKTVL